MLIVPSSASALRWSTKGNGDTRAGTRSVTLILHQLTELWSCGMHRVFQGDVWGGGNAPGCNLLQRSLTRLYLSFTCGDGGHPFHRLHEVTMTAIRHQVASFHFYPVLANPSFSLWLEVALLGTAQKTNLLGLIFWDIIGLLGICYEGVIVWTSLVILLYLHMRMRTISGIFWGERELSFS